MLFCQVVFAEVDVTFYFNNRFRYVDHESATRWGNTLMSRQSLHDYRTTVILDHMTARLAEPLSLHGVAHDLGMSASTAQRALRVQGVEFRFALAKIRVTCAEELLRRDPDLKVEALSLCVGWKSRKSLYDAVRRVTGRSLVEWRAGVRGLVPVADSSGTERQR